MLILSILSILMQSAKNTVFLDSLSSPRSKNNVLPTIHTTNNCFGSMLFMEGVKPQLLKTFGISPIHFLFNLYSAGIR